MLFPSNEKPSGDFASLEDFDKAFMEYFGMLTRASSNGIRESYWNAGIQAAILAVNNDWSINHGNRERLIASLKLLQRNT